MAAHGRRAKVGRRVMQSQDEARAAVEAARVAVEEATEDCRCLDMPTFRKLVECQTQFFVKLDAYLDMVARTENLEAKRIKRFIYNSKLNQWGAEWNPYIHPTDNLIRFIESFRPGMERGRRFVRKLQAAVDSGNADLTLKVAREVSEVPKNPVPQPELDKIERELAAYI